MLSVEDWAEIRRLQRAEGMPITAIARMLGVSRNTVQVGAAASDGPPKYERAPTGVGRGWVRAADPGAADGVSDDAGDGDRRADRLAVLDPDAERAGCAELRPAYLPPDPASRTSYAAGELAQCDFWFPDITVPVGSGQVRTAKRLPVLTMVSGYSRWLSAVLIPSRQRRGPVRGLVAADLGAGRGAAAAWSGTGKARSAGGGPDDPNSPRTARRSAARWG